MGETWFSVGTHFISELCVLKKGKPKPSDNLTGLAGALQVSPAAGRFQNQERGPQLP